MKNIKRPTRSSLERLARRWKREAMDLRWEVCEANLRLLKMQKDWYSDRRIFGGALQLLKEHGISAGSTEVIQAAIRAESPNATGSATEGRP